MNSCGCETHAWKEVVTQEAVEVDREVTNGREPSMSKGCLGQLSESAGHNASERRAGPENASRGSRPFTRKGKANADEAESNLGLIGSTGVMTMARDKGNSQATREIRRGGRTGRPTRDSRETDWAVAEVGEARSTVEAG